MIDGVVSARLSDAREGGDRRMWFGEARVTGQLIRGFERAWKESSVVEVEQELQALEGERLWTSWTCGWFSPRDESAEARCLPGVLLRDPVACCRRSSRVLAGSRSSRKLVASVELRQVKQSQA